ncbi:MAG TPA: response regulator, partial [Polyangiales bacterium]|nr:response regulator [Polyangiales bacterium]
AAETLRIFVERLGGTAETAEDALSGLDAVEGFRPDVVLLDIGMPGVDGFEACRLMRARYAERQLRIVALTGWGQPQDKAKALHAGFDAHLTKPVDPEVLRKLLASS